MGAVINGQLFLTPPQKILFFSCTDPSVASGNVQSQTNMGSHMGSETCKACLLHLPQPQQVDVAQVRAQETQVHFELSQGRIR